MAERTVTLTLKPSEERALSEVLGNVCSYYPEILGDNGPEISNINAALNAVR